MAEQDGNTTAACVRCGDRRPEIPKEYRGIGQAAAILCCVDGIMCYLRQKYPELRRNEWEDHCAGDDDTRCTLCGVRPAYHASPTHRWMGRRP